jgi:hypothetical protein
MQTATATLCLIGLAICATASASRGETAYFLMNGPFIGNGPNQSYVVPVDDAGLIKQARDYLAAGGGIPKLIPVANIATGSSPENRNYAEPGHPAWPWHVTRVTRWMEFDPRLPRAAVYLPEFDSLPSSVPDLLAAGHTSMSLLHFPLVMELDPARTPNVVNLSTRGWVDAGERALIGGFIVEGGQPRNVFIRALGPSLANFGVREPLADPKLTLFRGAVEIASNDNWRTTYLGVLFPPYPTFAPPPQEFAWMVPGDDREAVLWLSLPPGAYTVHVTSGDGTAGIALVEMYDLDASATR